MFPIGQGCWLFVPLSNGQTFASYHHRQRFCSMPSRGCVFMYFNLFLLLFNDVMIVILPTRIQHTHTDLYCKFRPLRSPFRYCCWCCNRWCYCSSRPDTIAEYLTNTTLYYPMLLLHLKSRHTRPPLERESSSFAFFALLSSSHTHSLTDWLTNRLQEFLQRFFPPEKKMSSFRKETPFRSFCFFHRPVWDSFSVCLISAQLITFSHDFAGLNKTIIISLVIFFSAF